VLTRRRLPNRACRTGNPVTPIRTGAVGGPVTVTGLGVNICEQVTERVTARLGTSPTFLPRPHLAASRLPPTRSPDRFVTMAR
jgi:hypothetical protein